MRLAIISAVIINLLAGAVAQAAIYCWYDAQGVTHYVDDLEKVPVEYRDQIVTFVTDRRPPEPLPREESSPPPASPEEPVAAPAARQEPERTQSAFEEGYWAGMASAHVSAPPEPAPVSFGPIVQNVQIFEAVPEIPSLLVVGPAFVPRALPPPPPRRLPPSRGDRFLQGPGGPPPIGAAGPPPVSFGHR